MPSKKTVVIDAGSDSLPIGKEGFGMLQSDKKTCWVNAQSGHAVLITNTEQLLRK